MLKEDIKNYLDKLDQGQDAITPYPSNHKIADEITKILKVKPDYEATLEDVAEQMAFDFVGEYSDDGSGWGTYYGPAFVSANQQGQTLEYPSIKEVDEEILNYWETRAKETKNPILSSRYADLVVDFSPKLVNKNAGFELFKIVIDSNITICDKLLANSLICKKKIKRALLLAIRINSKEKVAKAKKTVISLEEKIAIDSYPGCWGFAFKWLILDSGKKIALDKTEKAKLIEDMEERLGRVEEDMCVEHAASLLAEHYAKEKDEHNLMRVLGVLEKTLKTDARINSHVLLKMNAHKRMNEIYQEYANMGFRKAKMASSRISQEVGKLDPADLRKSMKEISIETKIERKHFDNYLKEVFGEEKGSEDDELKTIMAKVAFRHFPRKDSVEEELEEFSREFPLQSMITKQIISDDGILISEISPAHRGDDDSAFLLHASEHLYLVLQSDSFFLTAVTDELKKRISEQRIKEYFRNSTLFENESREYVERALSAYWNNDYLVSSHLFIPLIESAIRKLVEICDGRILTLNKDGGFDRFSLSQLFKKQGNIIESAFSEMGGQDMLFYFRFVLTEKRGLNLRNDFAHGLDKAKFSGREVSNRLFHIMTCLSLVEKAEGNSKQALRRGETC